MQYDEPVPILKWAGGKSQLIEDIIHVIPSEFGKTIDKYVEPFVGGGAMLFYTLSHYNVKEVLISDVNSELINMYNAIKENAESVIEILKRYEDTYLPLPDYERREFYYEKRNDFNRLMGTANSANSVLRAALFIFLNRTCFNGIYRVNRKGQFNVPMGAYKKPTICNAANIMAVSNALQKVNICCCSYEKTEDFIDEKTFLYLDPPYRPLKGQDNFKSYTEEDFNDERQKELAEYVRRICEKGAHFVLSNSDPKNVDPEDNFFDDLYRGYTLKRITAKRIINRKSSSRGPIREILVTNC